MSLLIVTHLTTIEFNMNRIDNYSHCQRHCFNYADLDCFFCIWGFLVLRRSLFTYGYKSTFLGAWDKSSYVRSIEHKSDNIHTLI